MKLLVGGKNKLITSNLDSEFKQAQSQGFVDVTGPKPQRGYGRSMTSAQDSKLKSVTGMVDYTKSAPLFNDPRYTSSTLSIPVDNRTLNGLYRFFAETDPVTGSAISIHSTLPLADFRLGQCEDSGVQQHYEDMWEKINGYKLMTDIVTELNEIGDTTVFGAWDNSAYMWSQFAVLNPDYVKIESTWVNQQPLIKLIPDEALKRVVTTRSPEFIYKQLPPEIIQYVLFNQEIPLDPNNVFHVAKNKRPYETRGRSMIKRVLKILMLEDRFNQANFAIATRHAVPMTLVKVGDPNGNWLPDDGDIDDVRAAFQNYELDPNFALFYHFGIDISFVGSSGKTLPVGPELDRINKWKMIGLEINEQILAGTGGSYAQAYINLEVQRQRYLNLQLKLEQMIHQGWFKVVADMCGFYRVRNSLGHTSAKSQFGNGGPTPLQTASSQFTSVRDFQDNAEFERFITAKTAEDQQVAQIREYVYPKADWGALSAAYDENMKNYVKWLQKERPWLVDDATLARLGRLDRDVQEKAYIKDLERKRDRLLAINKLGLGPLAQPMKGGGGGGDMGGMEDFGGGITSTPSIGEMPDSPSAPIGEGGPTAAADGAPPPAPTAAQSNIRRMLMVEGEQVTADMYKDDIHSMTENAQLLASRRAREDTAIESVIWNRRIP